MDTLLLAYVFENLSETCLHIIYGFDVSHYFTTSGLAIDRLLRYSNVERKIYANNEELIHYDQTKKKA